MSGSGGGGAMVSESSAWVSGGAHKYQSGPSFRAPPVWNYLMDWRRTRQIESQSSHRRSSGSRANPAQLCRERDACRLVKGWARHATVLIIPHSHVLHCINQETHVCSVKMQSLHLFRLAGVIDLPGFTLPFRWLGGFHTSLSLPVCSFLNSQSVGG